MKRMGKNRKSILALILSLTMFLQCLSVSATPVGADETQTTSATTTEQTAGTVGTQEDAGQPEEKADNDISVQSEASHESQNAALKVNEAQSTAEEPEKTVVPAEQNGTVKAQTAAKETTYINGVEFTVTSDGTAPFDDPEANGAADKRGNDSSATNDRIRSYDQMTYEVKTSFQTENGASVKGKKLYYAVTVPNDNNLELDWEATGLEEKVTPTVNTDGTKTYTFSFEITTQQAEGSGGIDRTVVLNVLGMKEGQTFQPTVKCWLENNADNKMPSGAVALNQDKNANEATAPETYVTSAPAYNIILKKGSVSGLGSFQFGTEKSKNAFDGTKYQATDYEEQTVKGFAVTWGVAVEMRKADASKGIRGIEYPDPNNSLTFDVDLSDVNYESGKKTTLTAGQWAPLLYQVRPNKEYSDHISVGDLPGSDRQDESNPSEKSRYCLDSGMYNVRQKETTLEFTIKGYKTERTQFPMYSLGGGVSYYTDLQKVLEGVFTSAQFTVVYPMVNSSQEDIQEKLGETGNYKFKAQADNLIAKSVDGTDTHSETIPLEVKNTDNISEIQANVVGGHGRTHEVYFSAGYPATAGSDGDRSGSMGNKGNDSDSATLGSQIFFTTDWTESNASIANPVEGRTVAADQLVLVEGDAIQIDKAARNDNTVSRGYYLYPMYVTADHPLSFEETKTLKMDSPDLSYCDDLKNVPEEQHVVGVLLRWRGISYSINKNGDDENSGNGIALVLNQTVASIKNNAANADKVYSITVQSKLYDTSILPDVAKEFTDNETEADKANAYREAARKLLGDGPLVRTNSSLTPESNGELDGRSNYTKKPDYDSTGYHSGEGFGRDRADSLYVVPYYTQITKTIAQKDKNGNQKNTYNFDKAEKYADYKLTGTLNFSESGMSYANGQRRTTITIKDTIPKGLTYLPDSAVWGPNSYTEMPGRPGKLTGGVKVTPNIVTNQDNSTTLTWTIQNVKVVNGELPALYYTCTIDRDVTDNQDLKNTATIQSSEEKRAICSANKNTSEAGLKITRSKGFNINKYGDHDLELNDDATFTLVASNATNTPRSNFLLVDSMPVDGLNGTVMKGTYNVTSLTINSDPNVIGDKGTEDIRVYYTTNKKYEGKTDINTFPLSEVQDPQIWTEATKIPSTDGDLSWNIQGWPTAIAIYDQSLGSYNTLLATIHYKAVADKDDHLVNYLLTKGANNATTDDYADAVIYDRALSGTVWVDDNFDGKMDTTEERVPGVKVQLMKQDEDGKWNPVESYVDTDGKKCKATQYTGENGYYEFTKLPEGKYKVVFTSGDEKDSPKQSDLSQYYMTTKNADKNTQITSKTDTEKSNAETGKLEEGDIKGISMPSIEEMKAKNEQHYNLPDQNMGLYKVDRSISGLAWFDANGDGVYDNNKEGDDKEYPMAGVKATLYVKKDGEFKAYQVGGKDVTTTTGDNGEYHFDNLPAGEYEVVFSDGTKASSTISDFDVTTSKQGSEPAVRSIATKDQDGKVTVSTQNDDKDSSITLNSDADLIKAKTSNQTIPNLNAGFKPEKTQIKVTKVWKDTDNADGLRPTADNFAKALTLNRYSTDKEGKESGEVKSFTNTEKAPTVTVKDKNDYTIQYDDLQKVSFDGEKFTYYIYKVKEGTVAGYTAVEGKDEVGDTKTITNTHVPQKVKRSLEGTAWFDENKDGEKNGGDSFEKSITVKLYQKQKDGTYQEVQHTTTDDKGHYKFENLDGGDYYIEFVNGKDSTRQSKESTDKKMTSIAKEEKNAEGKVIGSKIEKIHMPTDEEMFEKGISEYNKPHQDAGFISSTPDKPDKPSNPESTPETPNKPSNPESTSDKPSTPESTPDKPEKPSTPDKPDKPSTPESTPDKPSTPETTPDKPNKPSTPESTPDKPSTPDSTPSTPDKPTATPTPKSENTPTPTDTPKSEDTPTPEVTSTPDNPRDDTSSETPTPEVPQPTDHHDKGSGSFDGGSITNHYNTTDNGGSSYNGGSTTYYSGSGSTNYNSGSSYSSTNGSASADDTTTTGTSPVRTGDHSNAEIYIALLILAGVFITWEMIRNGKSRHKS